MVVLSIARSVIEEDAFTVRCLDLEVSVGNPSGGIKQGP